MGLNVFDKALAEKLYNEVLKLINDDSRFCLDKIMDLGAFTEEIYTEITKNDLPRNAVLNDRIICAKEKYTVPDVIFERSMSIKNTVNNKRHKNIKPKVSSYTLFIDYLIECNKYFSSVDVPQELERAYNNIHSGGKSNPENNKDELDKINKRMEEIESLINKMINESKNNKSINNDDLKNILQKINNVASSFGNNSYQKNEIDDKINIIMDKLDKLSNQQNSNNGNSTEGKSVIENSFSLAFSQIQLKEIIELIVFVIGSVLLLMRIMFGFIFIVLSLGLFFIRKKKFKYRKNLFFILISIHILFGIILWAFFHWIIGLPIIIGALLISLFRKL
jgi:hypothetical protein